MFARLGQLIGSQTSRQAAKAAIPGAALNFAVGTLAQGPAAGAAYAAGDFLLNYPLVGLARKKFPGTPGGQAVITTPKGQQITTKVPYAPSQVEQAINLGASLASMPIVDLATQGALYQNAQVLEPTNISQEQQIYQQALQRQAVNNLGQQALAPGTQFQMQGIEQTFHYPGVTLPPEVLAAMRQA
jgi:hypothetical protein